MIDTPPAKAGGFSVRRPSRFGGTPHIRLTQSP